jgi:hypothetical protein
MRYTNFILTVIAVLLALQLVRPTFIPGDASARNEITDVNIVRVAGSTVSTKGLPVHITENKDK